MKKRIDLIKQKQALALEMLQLTKRQANLFQASDEDDGALNNGALNNDTLNDDILLELGGLLDRRQNCIDKINDIDHQIDQEIDHKISNIESEIIAPATRTEIEQIQNKTREIFREIQAADQQNQQEFQSHARDLVQRTKSLQAGKVTTHKYQKKPRQVHGFFVDKKK